MTQGLLIQNRMVDTLNGSLAFQNFKIRNRKRKSGVFLTLWIDMRTVLMQSMRKAARRAVCKCACALNEF